MVQEQSRRFSLDLTPRLLYARGEMVELLISSNIARQFPLIHPGQTTDLALDP